MGEILGVGWGSSSSGSISDTQVIDLVDLILSEIERIEAARHLSGRSESMAESHIGIGKLSAQETIHIAVVARDLKVTEEHLN